MRIIAGDKARTHLLSPQGQSTRPITDRVKETLFNILQYRLADARVADLFCGTGSLGLEALSRGATSALLVDKDAEVLSRLRQNIDKCGFGPQSTVLKTNLFRDPPSAELLSHWNRLRPDLIFIDPPYLASQDGSCQSPLGQLLAAIGEQAGDGDLLVARHEKRTELLDAYGPFRLYDRRQYGRMALSFLESKRGQTPPNL